MRHSEYEHARWEGISRAIERAAVLAGRGGELLAGELAAVALQVMAERALLAPSPDEASAVVREVLVQTGHPEVAGCLPALAAWRRTSGSLAELRVHGDGGEGHALWDRSRLVSDLVLRRGLGAGVAERVATGVEWRLERLELRRVRSTLVDELVEHELHEAGFAEVAGRISLSRRRLDRWVHEPDAGAPLEHCVGTEVLRRYGLRALYDARSRDAHVAGEIEIDGLSYPRRALAASLHCGDLSGPGGAAPKIEAALKFVSGLEQFFGGPVFLAHGERSLGPALSSPAHARQAARQLLLALAQGSRARDRREPQCVLVVGTSLPAELLESLFHRGHDPERVIALAAVFVSGLLQESERLAPFVRVPRVRFLVPEDVGPLALLPPAADLYRAMARGQADCIATRDPVAALRIVGARVGVNAVRAALRCGRGRRRQYLAALRTSVEKAVEAGGRRVRFLTSLDGQGVGPLRRLRGLVEELSREMHLDLPGRHAYLCSVVPVGVDVAVRAVLERDPAESEAAAALKEEVLESMRQALPAAGSGDVHFVLSKEPFPTAEQRFGRLDFAAFPRGRDILRLAHDGAAFRYATQDGADAFPHVLDPGLDPHKVLVRADLDRLFFRARKGDTSGGISEKNRPA